MAETEYVFLRGNSIPECWENWESPLFRIGELGFGTGLNFFVTKHVWEKTQNPPSIGFVSLEKYPLGPAVICQMQEFFPELKPWREDMLASYSEFLQSKTYPMPFQWKFNHPKNSSNFFLSLYLGDVLEILSSFPSPIDCFYLDGFAPQKNPDMWSLEVMRKLRALSKPGTKFSTFTAAGFVKRNLQEAGFTVLKTKGYGKKREMLVGSINETEPF